MQSSGTASDARKPSSSSSSVSDSGSSRARVSVMRAIIGLTASGPTGQRNACARLSASANSSTAPAWCSGGERRAARRAAASRCRARSATPSMPSSRLAPMRARAVAPVARERPRHHKTGTAIASMQRDRAVIELHGRHVVEEILPPRLDQHDLGRHQRAVHQRERVVREARADARDEAAADDHEEHERDHEQAARRSRGAHAARRAWRDSSDSATHSIAPKMRNASARCAVSRNCDTRGSSTSPLFTMYQPSAPCRPPSTKIAASLPP